MTLASGEPNDAALSDMPCGVAWCATVGHDIFMPAVTAQRRGVASAANKETDTVAAKTEKMNLLNIHFLEYGLLYLSHGSLKRHTQQFLRLHGKLHRKLVEHILGVAVDNESDSLLCRNATLVAVEQLVF